MVCIYCGQDTQVVNSRLQKRSNHVWRRRQCINCAGIFTTQEAPDLSSSIRVQISERELVPFLHAKLFISIYESCKHRAQAFDDATAMTELVVARIMADTQRAIVTKTAIAKAAHTVLAHFDSTAGTIYTAYHLPKSSSTDS